MDKLAQQLLKQINSNLENISLYIERLSKEEIKIDSQKIFIIDYSSYLWLNLTENSEIKKQLEEYNQQSINDIINDDFVEFCRKIYLQIEILLNQFILKQYGIDRIQDISYSKKAKLADFLKIINSNKVNFKLYENEDYKIITSIMDIRDIASHGDLDGKSIKERIEAKGKSIKVRLKSLKEGIHKEEIQTLFIQFVLNQKGIKVSGRIEEGWAYITLYNLKNSFLDAEKVVNEITNNLSILQYKLGRNVKVFPDAKQPQNELKEFFDKKDYQKIHKTVNWFVKEIINYLK
ncbi:hypothetical protein [Nostoc sp. 106C]|uniref:hypothetical protein n=1 Tax=Nostoc sp. 106C TaxID=1932667 RepID=UPI000A37885B|nr:hypothetical protein [Nostoc sp. 106C]OUL30520.1 hypothetical protein BV375_13680 [Nostoc sp. 106C]